MTWVAGIDGGGTSTRLQVRDAQNAVLSSAEFGPFNIASIGVPAMIDWLAITFSHPTMAPSAPSPSTAPSA